MSSKKREREHDSENEEGEIEIGTFKLYSENEKVSLFLL